MLHNRLPTGPNVLAALDEFTVTFVDHTTKDLGAITLAELMSYVGSGGEHMDANNYDCWPEYNSNYRTSIFTIYAPKPNITFTIGRDGQDVGWEVEFVV